MNLYDCCLLKLKEKLHLFFHNFITSCLHYIFLFSLFNFDTIYHLLNSKLSHFMNNFINFNNFQHIFFKMYKKKTLVSVGVEGRFN